MKSSLFPLLLRVSCNKWRDKLLKLDLTCQKWSGNCESEQLAKKRGKPKANRIGTENVSTVHHRQLN